MTKTNKTIRGSKVKVKITTVHKSPKICVYKEKERRGHCSFCSICESSIIALDTVV